MKAFITRGDGIDGLSLVERATPKPNANEVLVNIRATSLNYRDLLVLSGKGSWKPTEPRVPLSDGAGEIVAVGAAVTKWQTGDRVAGIFYPRWIDGDLTHEKLALPLGGAAADGVLTERRTFHENAIVKIPNSFSFEEAATLPCAAVTSWHAVSYRSRVKRGETVLIQGTGGVSLFALQFSRVLGAHIIATSSNEEKLEKVRRLGAEFVINYRDTPNWDERVRDLTAGAGAHHIFEVVGGANLNRSLNALRMSGAISVIGLLGGGVGEVNTSNFFARNANLHGVEVGSRKMFEDMNAFIEQHQIKPVIDRVFDFSEVKEALRYLESGAHFGKIVVKI